MNWLIGIVSVVIAEVVGGVGALFTTPQITTWYATLIRPSFSPPNWLFGPTWTLLYALMGIAVALVWMRRKQRPVGKALAAYGIQLALNAAWSPVFFGGESPLGGVLIIIPMLVAIVVTTVLFWRISRTAGWLMVPYIAWVSFASVLNVAIWRLNS